MESIRLLKERSFAALVVTQALSVFIEVFFKYALVMLIARQALGVADYNFTIQLLITSLLFLLPWIVFAPIAGQLVDKYDAAKVVKVAKLAEIGIAVLILLGFIVHNHAILLCALGLLATQSIFLATAKYSMLPLMVPINRLLTANGLLIASVLLAVVLAIVCVPLFSELDKLAGIFIASLILLLAIVGWFVSLIIEPLTPLAAKLKLSFNIPVVIQQTSREISKQTVLVLSILGTSWFWFIMILFVSQIIHFVASDSLKLVLLSTFSIAVIIGSLACSRLLKGKLNTIYVPAAVLGMSIFLVDFSFAFNSFVEQGYIIRVLIDLLLIGFFAGAYVVPLYVALQSYTPKSHIGRVFAFTNFINSLVIVVGVLFVGLMLWLGMSKTILFLSIAVINTVIAIYICRIIPDAVIKSFINWLFRAFYQVKVVGMDNFHKAGKRVVMVANHTSYLDALLLTAFIPERLTLAMKPEVAKQFWLTRLLKLVTTIDLDPTNPMVIKDIIEHVRANHKVLMFPEGRVTVTGALMKIYEEPGMIADKANAKILPICISGAQYSYFSLLRGRVKLRLFPKIIIIILAPQSFEVPEEFRGRSRREYIGRKLYDIMTSMIFSSSEYHMTLFEKLIESKKLFGGGHRIIEDIEAKPLPYRKVILGSFVLGKRFNRLVKPNSKIGLLLPNVNATVVSFFACHAYGHVPAMLNYTAGITNLISAVTMAKINLVISSRQFIEAAELQDIEKELAKYVKIIYLEDIRDQLNLFDKLFGLFHSLFPLSNYHRFAPKVDTNDCAVVLYTSGSEGAPKGVALSHKNLQANCAQVSAVVDFSSQDIVFNALPIFHTFGLTGGVFLPIFSGIKCVLYPSPLHYRIIPEMVYETNATLMFGTDTFLNGYAKHANPYDFYSLRYVFAGAEKLRDETRHLWMDKFGVRVFEGYGVTETSPILSANTPMCNRPGTVGRMVPGIEYKLVPVPGIDHGGGELYVKGPNVMLGYFKIDKPGIIQPLENHWYNTGDVVTVSEDGYITIIDRTKRFAKLAGEMVSLAAVETYIYSNSPDAAHAVVAIPDPKKGEQLVLMTQDKTLSREKLLQYAKQAGMPELTVPRQVFFVDEVPLLGSGKVNYAAAKQLALQLMKQEKPSDH